MAHILSFSEAAAIGIHTVLLLAIDQGHALTTRSMSASLNISDHHCAKVMRRLVKAGIVKATRGPGGGFTLAHDAAALTLIQVYQVIEGELEEKHCLFQTNKCPAQKCLFHELTLDVNKTVRDYLSKTTFADLARQSK